MADKLPWWGPARVPFLWLTPSCMALGVAACWALARQHGLALAWPDALLAVLGALAAHVSVNALNEYSDFRSGLDSHTQRTPFSGGSGVLPAHPELAPAALLMGCASLAVTALAGLYFLWTQPGVLWPLAPVGLVGMTLVVAYTPWVTRHPWLCLLAPGLSFGPLMMLGASAVLLGRLSEPVALLAMLPFGLVNNLLLLNQFPDVDADRSASRLTLPMLLGRAHCWPVLAGLFVLAYGALLAAVWLLGVPWGACLGLLTLPLAVNVVWGAARHAEDVPALLPFMGMNVLTSLLTPVLAALGIVLSA
jgi:1,4-dihydroxy-2-naphthoate octaprenyltransferase